MTYKYSFVPVQSWRVMDYYRNALSLCDAVSMRKKRPFLYCMLKVYIFCASLFFAVFFTSCVGGGGGGGGTGAVTEGSRSSGASVPAGGWGGNIPGVSGGGGGNGSFSIGAAPDLDYQTITLTVTVTSDGVTTTTSGDINSSEISNVMSSLKGGDVVQVSAAINMQDGTTRTTSSDVVTIGVTGNEFELPTPYIATYNMTLATIDPAFQSSSSLPDCTLGTVNGVSIADVAYTSAGGTVPVITPPAGYIIDHWETSAGVPFVFGVSRGDVTIHPVCVPDSPGSASATYTVTCDVDAATLDLAYNDSSIITGGSVNHTTVICTAAGGGTEPTVTPPSGYIFDHWVTSTGALFDFGTVTQDVTVHPVYVMDYTVTNLPTVIIIATPNDFTNLMSAHSEDDFDGITIKLMCNVSTTVGFSNNSGFKGTFDGNGKTVTVNLTEYAFIAKNTGTIKNLVISGQIVNTSSNYTGGIVGENTGTIENCGNKASVQGGRYAGGIANLNNGLISCCYNLGAITGNSSSTCGGIAGRNSNGGTIENCYNKGSIDGRSLGGITGASTGSSSITNCYSTDFTNCGNQNCGCIIGMGASSCTISNVYCDGNSGCSNSEDLATANENVTISGLVDNSIWEAGSDGMPRLIDVPGQ